MSADVLREAAQLMRSRAEAAFEGPWDGPDQFGVIRAGYGSAEDGELVHGEDCGCGGGIGYEPNAEHIASWHPVVALAVADLLDNEASLIDSVAHHPDLHMPINDARCDLLTAIADAYLGGDQ